MNNFRRTMLGHRKRVECKSLVGQQDTGFSRGRWGGGVETEPEKGVSTPLPPNHTPPANSLTVLDDHSVPAAAGSGRPTGPPRSWASWASPPLQTPRPSPTGCGASPPPPPTPAQDPAGHPCGCREEEISSSTNICLGKSFKNFSSGFIFG